MHILSNQEEWQFDNDSTLLVIGNGFDLSLGLNTSYQNFINSEQFRPLLMTNYFAQYLKTKFDIKRWVDIENEIPQYLSGNFIDSNKDLNNLVIEQGRNSKIAKHKECLENFKADYKQVKNHLVTYLKTLPFENIDRNNNVIDFISKIGSLNNLFVLNFNYTDTFERIVDLMYPEKNVKTNILHIHGTLDEGIVFGVQDKVENNYPSVSAYNYVYKSSSPYLKSYGINNYLEKCSHIIFLGYSLGVTDESYFKNFFKYLASRESSANSKIIDIIYFNEDALDDLNKRTRDLADGNLSAIRNNHKLNFVSLSQIKEYFTSPIVLYQNYVTIPHVSY